MPFTLPDLPYADSALEPVIDAKTMSIHRTKHHQAYVTNLNKALEGHADLQSLPIEELCRRIATLPESIRTAVRNNGGGHFNHSLFWQVMAPAGSGGSPDASLSAAISAAFGSIDGMKEKFAAAAAGRFGSGWAWLGAKKDGSLSICSTPNQDNPLMEGIVECGCTPILGLDVWEHAYYLHYQNRRPDYVAAWWGVVNWNEVNRRYAAAKA
jgi:Fe-Mn family superoxide dismutase